MKIRISILLIFTVFALKAQHAYFASLSQNLLILNPAFAGTNGKLRVQAINGITGFPIYSNNKKSYYAGVDFMGNKYSGFGLSFSSDTYGPVLRRTQADFTYALHLTVREKIKIVPAIQLSYFEYKFDQTKMSSKDWNDLQSSILNNGRTEMWSGFVPAVYYKRNVDLSAGILVYGKRFYAGASFLSLTRPDEGFLGVSKRPLTQIYQGKYRFLDPEKFSIDIYGLLKLQKRLWFDNTGYNSIGVSQSFFQYGTYLNYKMLSIHLAQQINDVSNYDALIAGVALNGKGFRVGYNNKCNYGNHVSTYFFNEFYLQYAFGRIKKDDEENQDKTIKLID